MALEDMNLGYTTYVELKEEVIKDVEEVLGERFHRKGNLVPIAEINDTLRDLLIEIDKKQEDLDDEIEQRKNYYKPKSHMEIEGVPERGPIY